MTLESKCIDWLIQGEKGISSEAMCAAVLGRKPERRWPGNWPHDPDDLKRCLLFLKAVPEARDHLDKVAKINATWRRLIARWDELESAFNAEVPDVKARWSAPKTYELMQKIIERKK